MIDEGIGTCLRFYWRVCPWVDFATFRLDPVITTLMKCDSESPCGSYSYTCADDRLSEVGVVGTNIANGAFCKIDLTLTAI